MLGLKSMSGVRDVARGGSWPTRLLNTFTSRAAPESFEFDAVVTDACAAANVAVPSEADLPHARWWKKLCRACQGKTGTTKHGSQLLRSRLTNALAQRLAVEEVYRLNGGEIEKEVGVDNPIVVMGLPRSNGHMAAHVLARSGLFLTPRQCDTLSPSLLLDVERRDAFHKKFRGFSYLHPDFLCVRVPQVDQVDDDLTMHLMTPQSYAWGLLHGLDEYLLECLEEDQLPVYTEVRRVMELFQWYRKCGHFSEPVTREFEPIDNVMELQTYGTKNVLLHPQWLLYSPFAILSSDAVNTVFPKMRVIWVHRALSQCLPSLCSALCLHNSLYTGKPPSDSQLASMGDKVLGIFGSGTEYAIEYYGKFDQLRMAHWSNRDVKRHATRVAAKTLDYFGIELDHYRRMQMISGQTEYVSVSRPLHDAQMPYFCLHDGVIGDVFQDYIYQFTEFAYEKKFGITVKEYTPLAAPADAMAMQGIAHGSSEPRSAPSLGAGQPMVGHFQQEGKGFR
ncbi:hypothetical protein JIQ42_04341 [Leishmania sp. Namibia]|uniref:hypothetical protein n=1 Tax=Leishmania sp. Namibia TaxID=2802991 RepID=UPI001B60099D|nr:hypothetical protein JIQ42_04341 [Leishmania sp. Namibia]